MGASDLDKFINSPEADGIVAGFEAEMCFKGLGGGENEDWDNMERDNSEDTRPDDIDEICNFFDDGEYNSRRDIENLRESLTESYQEWRYNQMSEEWSSVEESVVRDYIEENDFDFDATVEEYLRDELELSEAQISAAIEAGIEYASFTSTKQQYAAKSDSEAMAHYAEAADHANQVLDDAVSDAISEQNRFYDRAREEWEDEHREDEEWNEERWLRENSYRWMSDIEDSFDIQWPYWVPGTSEGGNEFNEAGAEQLADSLRSALDVRVTVGSGYHSAARRPGRWIIEADSSVEADYDDMPAEIVSPPYPLKECIAKMQEYFAWAVDNDGYTNESTGLHVGVSVPFAGGNVDYLKLALFLGDMYVLEQFDRASNTFCKSALKKIEADAKKNPDRVSEAMLLMKKGLVELAAKALKQTTGHGKYTSINLKGEYIEFRSMGGDYLDHKDEIISNVKRYAYAMYIASRPDLYRDEYAKKLYKLISGTGSETAIDLFVKVSTGKLTREEAQAQLRSKQMTRQAEKNGGTWWWNVQWDSNRRIEVVAKNKNEARQVAAKEWRVPVEDLAVAKVTVLRPYEAAADEQPAPPTPPAPSGNDWPFANPTPPRGEFSGEWQVLDDNGQELYRFGGIGNRQSDANRVASEWLRSRGLTNLSGFDVLPVMR